MKRGEWIVCERTNRWAAGLRTIAARHAITEKTTPRVVEVRSLDELASRLDEQPGSLLLIEVHTGNLANVLAWLADTRDGYPQARFFAVLDYSLATGEETWPVALADEHHNVASALLEAGVVDVAESPRHLHNILAIAERHWALVAIDTPSSTEYQPLLEWARSLLPWQDR